MWSNRPRPPRICRMCGCCLAPFLPLLSLVGGSLEKSSDQVFRRRKAPKQRWLYVLCVIELTVVSSVPQLTALLTALSLPIPTKDCSASMIAPNLVITAAHCVSNFGSSCYPSGTFTASEYSGTHLESPAMTFCSPARLAMPSLTLAHTHTLLSFIQERSSTVPTGLRSMFQRRTSMARYRY